MIVGLVGSCDLLLTWVVCGSLDLWFGFDSFDWLGWLLNCVLIVVMLA